MKRRTTEADSYVHRVTRYTGCRKLLCASEEVERGSVAFLPTVISVGA
jgi:hypothetical protein